MRAIDSMREYDRELSYGESPRKPSDSVGTYSGVDN